MSRMNRKNRRRRSVRQRRRASQHRRSMLAVSAVIILLAAVVSVNGITLRAKDKAYREQIEELEQRIEEEEQRTAEIDDLEKYINTDEYVEELAKEKLGLVNENEIIFKAE